MPVHLLFYSIFNVIIDLHRIPARVILCIHDPARDHVGACMVLLHIRIICGFEGTVNTTTFGRNIAETMDKPVK